MINVAVPLLIVCAVMGVLFVVVRAVARWSGARRQMRRRADLRVRGLPGAVSLLQVATAAGLPPRAAIAAVANIDSALELDAVLSELGAVSRRLDLGADLSSAILALDRRDQRRMVKVIDVLRRAEVDGVALATHLDILVRDLRRERAVALDVAAQRLTVSLLFPLVVCILPAFVLLAVVPLLLGAFSNLPG